MNDIALLLKALGMGDIVELEDVNGVALDVTDGFAVIGREGSGDVVFYFPEINAELISMHFTVDETVTMAFKLQEYVLGAYRTIPGYNAPTADSYAADGESEEIHGVYPLVEIISEGAKFRAVITVGGTCNVACQAVARSTWDEETE